MFAKEKEIFPKKKGFCPREQRDEFQAEKTFLLYYNNFYWFETPYLRTPLKHQTDLLHNIL